MFRTEINSYLLEKENQDTECWGSVDIYYQACGGGGQHLVGSACDGCVVTASKISSKNHVKLERF